MKLVRILLRYFPPGIILEFKRRNDRIESRAIDLLDLTDKTDEKALVEEIMFEEPMIKKKFKKAMIRYIQKMKGFLKDKQQEFAMKKHIQVHEAPLDRCVLNHYGES